MAWPRANTGRTETVIFLHMPRTGGTTLYRIIDRLYDPSTVFTLEGPRGEPLRKYLELPDEQRRRLRLVKGHIAYGFDELVPNPAMYITLLRHPAERVASTYYFIQRTPSHTHYTRIMSEQMSLEDFVRSGVSKVAVDNGQTRLLSGAPDAGNGVPFRGCTREMLESARQHLRESFLVVGLTERFDESLILMRRALGWKKTPFYQRHNIGVNRPKGQPLPPEVRALIEEYNSLDMELYQSAVELFEAQARRQGPTFPVEVQVFQYRNRRFSRTPRGALI